MKIKLHAYFFIFYLTTTQNLGIYNSISFNKENVMNFNRTLTTTIIMITMTLSVAG